MATTLVYVDVLLAVTGFGNNCSSVFAEFPFALMETLLAFTACFGGNCGLSIIHHTFHLLWTGWLVLSCLFGFAG